MQNEKKISLNLQEKLRKVSAADSLEAELTSKSSRTSFA